MKVWIVVVLKRPGVVETYVFSSREAAASYHAKCSDWYDAYLREAKVDEQV